MTEIILGAVFAAIGAAVLAVITYLVRRPRLSGNAKLDLLGVFDVRVENTGTRDTHITAVQFRIGTGPTAGSPQTLELLDGEIEGQTIPAKADRTARYEMNRDEVEPRSGKPIVEFPIMFRVHGRSRWLRRHHDIRVELTDDVSA